MKKKLLGIFVCMLLIATALPAVGTINKDDMNTTPQRLVDVEWEYTYGGDEHDWLYHVQPTSDGGYIAAGISEEDNMFYGWLLKVDALGEEEWSTVNYDINGSAISSEIIVMCVREIPDEGYVATGWSRWYDEVNEWWATVGWLWKVDETGATVGVNIIGDAEVPYTVIGFNVLVVEDGFIVSGGYMGTSFEDVGLVKTDFDCNVEWVYHYDHGGSNMEYTRTLWLCDDEGYFLGGTVEDTPDQGGILMMKVDSDGNEEWASIFDGPATEYCDTMSGRQTDDGGFIISGTTYSYGAGGSDLWVIKIDADGDMEWNKTYGGPDNERNYGMDGTADGGYVFIVIKNAYSGSGTKEDTWILTTDNEGNPEWELIIEEEGTQWVQSIEQTDDEGFIIAGRTGSWEDPNSDGMLLKVGPFPQLDIEFTGGLGVEATITNNGLGDAVQAPYEMTVTGGILGLINKTVNGTIDIDAGATESISSGLLFGLGGFEITVKVGVKEETAQGFQFLVFSIVSSVL